VSTKLEPGAFDCYAKLADDEPYFVLRAKDPHAPALVELWAALREVECGHNVKVAEARLCAVAMIRWFRTHGGQSLSDRNAARCK
jgi:hypothetical protein